MKFALALSLSLMFLSSCRSVQPSRQPDSDRSQAALEKLKAKLQVDSSNENLGLQEKSFDSCKLKYHEADGKCGQRVFTAINFRMRCRDSEGTTSEVPGDLLALMSPNIVWKMGSQKGTTSTDGEGFGQILAVSSTSLKGDRLVLIAGKQFLGIDVSDASGEIIVPLYWCVP